MPTAIDLFCGCGGLSLGFQNAGFTILRAFDIWDKAINNYNLNFSHPAELQDINQLSPDYLKSFSPDVIIGGPPCIPSWSVLYVLAGSSWRMSIES